MYDSHVTHGKACHARTMRTTCQYCGKSVFYFKCDHDSRVFFDALGQPWPKHRCAEYLKAASRSGMTAIPSPSVAGSLERLLSQNIMARKEHDFPFDVEPGYVTRMQKNLEAERAGKRGKVRMDPPPRMGHHDIGQIADLAEQVNVFKQARLREADPLARVRLGPLGEEPMARILLVVDDLEQDDQEEYACYIPQRVLNQPGMDRGSVVQFTIEPVEVLGWERVWLCIELKNRSHERLF